MAYQDEVLADSPTRFWRMEETSGSTVTDEVEDDTGTVSGAADLDVSSVEDGLGSAIALSGGRVTIGHHADLTIGTGFTFECWARIDDPNSDALQTIADKQDLSGSSGQWSVRWDNRSSAQTLSFQTGADRLDHVADSALLTDLQAGVHCVAVFDDGARRLYIDGTLVESDTGSAGTDDGNDLILGDRESLDFPLGGLIDEVAIYDFALSATRVQAHFDARNDSAGDAETVTDQAGIADIVSVVLDVREATITDGLGITDADADYTVDTDSDDTDPVGLTDTVIAQITGIGGVPARGPITIRPLGRVTVR